jgi:hypothetical protein
MNGSESELESWALELLLCQADKTLERPREEFMLKAMRVACSHIILCGKWVAVQSETMRTNHIMWTMGEDFAYEYAETWYKQLDKLIHYVNKV